MAWSPKRTLHEVEALLRAPGSSHELETRLVEGRMQRTYKNQWPSLRVFWLWAASEHRDAIYLVYENKRYTYNQVNERAAKAAPLPGALTNNIFVTLNPIGDRVAICARNYPEYMVAFWACHLIGAVSVLANAWSPLDVLFHCLVHTECKVVIVDSERADQLEPLVTRLRSEAKTTGILVIESQEGKGRWEGIEDWDNALSSYSGAVDAITGDPAVVPEDDASIYFTSGTTGLPKGVLSTQRQYITNIMNVLVGTIRGVLRRGESPAPAAANPQKAILLSVPLFHVTGSTSLAMLGTLAGMKVVLMRKWDLDITTRLLKEENITVAGGVPSMVADLVDNSHVGQSLEALMFGGAPAPDSLPPRTRSAFPSASMSQGYGLTETNGIAVAVAAEDYFERPTTCGLAMPVNDIVVVKDGVIVPPNTVGEIWIRGPNVMKGYWKDPVATNKVITPDGWFLSGDLGYLDEEGFLYIKDRIKDIIIRGGENIDSVTVENALYADERVLEAAAVSVPDERLGELVAAAVSVKQPYWGKVTETDLIKQAAKVLPKFAVPVIIVVQNEPFERTPSAKILKAPLRDLVREAWKARVASGGVGGGAKL